MQQDNIDNGPNPNVINIEAATLNNENYRTTIWTGKNLQSTLMSINKGEDIGLEVHEDHDQFLRVEQGSAKVMMGKSEADLMSWDATDGDAIFVPAGYWHNVVNSGDDSLKLYSIYAPPQHPHGTIHKTRIEAELAERDH